MLSEPGNSRRRIRRACTRTCCIVNLLQHWDNGRLANKWIKSIKSKRNAADMELKVHFFRYQDIRRIKFSPLSWDLTIWLDLLWNVLSRGAWWWSQDRPRVWARPSQRGSCRTEPGWRSSRFPCCVLSYFSLVFVMEHKQTLTNPSYKSQLSREIN